MEWFLLAAAVIGLVTALPRMRNGGWKRAALPVVWVVVLVPLIGSVHSTPIQVVGIVLMFVGAWWLGEWSTRRFPAS